MSILFDIKHVAHINFFKPTIERLVSEGEDVLISYIHRGRLPKIIKAEFPNIPAYPIGSHKGNTFSILFEANFLKFFKSLKLLKKHNINLMLGVDAFVTGFACKILGIPNIQFYDDPERKVNLWLEQKTSTELYYPSITDFSNTSVKTYYGLKEWAYLSPSQFKPSVEALEKYKIAPGEYYFIREVDNGSLNYQGQDSGLIAQVAHSLSKGIKVILSLENKKSAGLYPDNWQILEEPVQDIHSLMYYSKCVISSGDSMAREGAMLGVPSYYVGFRDMAANRFIQKEGLLFVVSPQNLSSMLEKEKGKMISQDVYRTSLKDKWIDVTNMICELINKYKYK